MPDHKGPVDRVSNIFLLLYYCRDGLEVPKPKGFRFNGDGYIVMAKDRFDPKRDTTVVAKFRTFDENGLIVVMGDDTGGSYLALELRDGRVFLKYDLGSGPAEIITDEGIKFNDGQWHEVSVRRINQRALVKVDGKYCKWFLLCSVPRNVFT